MDSKISQTIKFNGVIYRLQKSTNYYRSRVGGVERKLHREIWRFYNGEIPKKYIIHHKDCNKFNNKIDNLEYLTASENMKHAYKNNRIDRTPWNKGKKGLQVAWNKGLKLSIKEIK